MTNGAATAAPAATHRSSSMSRTETYTHAGHSTSSRYSTPT